ncbi:MAG: hypothetical protein KatS3mg114_1277 [Planctomycetaceae bacterium]|nr:MAG: hypothetical protein KatS3mg114_1277 [Planctomycetaceae bacterium]
MHLLNHHREPASPLGVTPTLSWSVLSADERKAALAMWRSVEHQHPQLPLLSRTAWVETWLEVYGEVVDHRFVICFDEDRPVAVILLTYDVDAARVWWGGRIGHVGTAGEPDADSVCVEYNAIACLPGYETAVWAVVLMYLRHQPDWDAWQWDGFESSLVPEDLLFSGGKVQRVVKMARYVDFTSLREQQRELIEAFGNSTRSSIRQNLRHYAPCRLEWCADLPTAEQAFEQLMELHQQRWQAEGQPGCYASPLFTTFHRQLLRRLVPSGQMVITRVWQGETLLGCSQVLIDRQRALLYQGGRIIDQGKHSPGLVTDFLTMQACYQQGYRAFDFMAGDSLHKRRLTTHTAELVWLAWVRPSWKGRVLEGLRLVKRSWRWMVCKH